MQPRISLCQSWHVVLYERFCEEYPTPRSSVDIDTSQRAGNGNGPGPRTGTATATGSSSSLRWLLFIMGPLPQAIRLASFKGVFWSKCIGFSFLFPWVLCEISIFLYARMRTQQHTSPDLAFLASVRLKPRSPDYDDRFFYGAMMLYIPIVFLVYFTFVFCALSGWVMIIALVQYPVSLMGFVWLLYLLEISLDALCKRFPWVGRVMLVTFVKRVKDKDVVVMDDKAFFLLVVFVFNFLMCGVGYAYFYDGAGTVNPGWTGVFG
ncbi:hypothetical protein BKA61DRAFT_601524 [Leptodontidium sp. MPI-SDFR-AT-0119]|nr:hypothetical protein BKA61DRAFT_601524 [Leptodontidium sp. MPI-SDFR-AT-0119]